MTTVGTGPAARSGRYNQPLNVTPSSVLKSMSLRIVASFQLTSSPEHRRTSPPFPKDVARARQRSAQGRDQDPGSGSRHTPIAKSYTARGFLLRGAEMQKPRVTTTCHAGDIARGLRQKAGEIETGDPPKSRTRLDSHPRFRLVPVYEPGPHKSSRIFALLFLLSQRPEISLDRSFSWTGSSWPCTASSGIPSRRGPARR